MNIHRCVGLTCLIAAIEFLGGAHAHEYACHRGYTSKEATIGFYEHSFESAEILHTKVLKDRMEAGRLLEVGVLADIKGEPAEKSLRQSLDKLKETRSHMDALYIKLEDMIEHEKNNEALPEHKVALQRILSNLPPLERVSLTNSRFANVSGGGGVSIHYGQAGKDFPELLGNLQSDLKILMKQHDDLISSFQAAIPVAKNGGFAAMVLSGRAPLPERVMHTADQIFVFTQFYDRACMASIAADMQVYPKGFDWLPQVNWRAKE